MSLYLKVKISLFALEKQKISEMVNEIHAFLKEGKFEFSGPIYMPTKKLRIQTRKSRDGEGTERWDKWRLSKYKAIFITEQNERILKKLMQIKKDEYQDITIEFINTG